jgi:hypothetical protein
LSGGTEQEITADAGTGFVMTPIHLDHGTYRRFCGNDGPPNHEERSMFVDIALA